jgi:predicted N-acetyltransferase YhbS
MAFGADRPMTPSPIIVRSERPGDAGRIADVVRRAYADVAFSNHREYHMIDRLRETVAFIPALSLLAEIDGEAAGHILLTRAEISGDNAAVATLALAPLSVAPEYQGRGVGKRLVKAAHAQAAAIGFGSIVLVGLPDYYPQFGYRPLRDYPITLPFAAPEPNCMILPLHPDALDGVAGEVRYATGWLEH